MSSQKSRFVSPIFKKAEGLILKARVQYDILTDKQPFILKENTDRAGNDPLYHPMNGHFPLSRIGRPTPRHRKNRTGVQAGRMCYASRFGILS